MKLNLIFTKGGDQLPELLILPDTDIARAKQQARARLLCSDADRALICDAGMVVVTSVERASAHNR